MLSDIVAQVVRRTSRWRPATWDPEDLEQEAWVAVLEVSRGGVTDPKEILRRAEDRVQSKATRESRRPESAIGWITEAGGALARSEEVPLVRRKGAKRRRGRN